MIRAICGVLALAVIGVVVFALAVVPVIQWAWRKARKAIDPPPSEKL